MSASAGLDGVPLVLAIVLARWAVLLGPAVLLWLWLTGAPGDRTAAVAAGVAAVLGLAAAGALASVVTLPRPFMDGSATNYLDHARDSSFPSDHATFMFSLAFAFLFRPAPKLPRAWVVLLAAAIAIGWARVFLNTHYPLDILGGALLGAGAAALTVAGPVAAAVRGLDGIGEAIRCRAMGGLRRRALRRPAKGLNP